MFLRKFRGVASVTLPGGKVLSQSDLPPKDTVRWVASRKATVVQAVDHGLLAPEEARSRYGLSEEELESWRAALTRHGAVALKTTRIQDYR